MRRRSILRKSLPAVGLILFPGCIDNGTVKNNGKNSSGNRDFPELAIVSVDETSDGSSIAVENISEFEEDSPAQIEITFTNSMDEPKLYTFGSVMVFSGYVGEHVDGHAELWLEPENGRGYTPLGDSSSVPTEPDSGCWQYPIEEYGVHDFEEGVTLEPGESISNQFDIFHRAPTDRCLPSGRYRFADSDSNHSETWGFVVELSY